MSNVRELLGDEKIRFHVIDHLERQRSSDWIIWESNESLYVSTTSLSGSLKLSMHPRGLSNDGKDCQFSTTSAFWRKLLSRGNSESAPFHRWKRPDPHENQVCLVASVTFPTAFLMNVVKNRKLGGRKLAFPLPEIGQGFELSIFNHRVASTELEASFIAKGFTPFISIGMDSSENFSLVGRYVPFHVEWDQLFPKDQGAMIWFGQADAIMQPISRAHAIMVHDYPNDGEPILLAEINGIDFNRKT